MHLKTQNVAVKIFLTFGESARNSITTSSIPYHHIMLTCEKDTRLSPLFLHCKQVTEMLGGKLGTWLRTHPGLTSSYDNFNGWQGRVDEADLYLICACGGAIDGCLISSILSPHHIHPCFYLVYIYVYKGVGGHIHCKQLYLYNLHPMD